MKDGSEDYLSEEIAELARKKYLDGARWMGDRILKEIVRTQTRCKFLTQEFGDRVYQA